MPHEVARLTEFGLPVTTTSSGANFIRKDQTIGVCPALKDGRCSIYADRPLTCQIYPFDLIVLPGHAPMWVKHNVCPAEQYRSSIMRSKNNAAVRRVCEPLLQQMEAQFSIELAEMFITAAARALPFDLLDNHRNDYTNLRELRLPHLQK